MHLVNLFYDIARQHKKLKGFFYGKAYEKGAGNEAHPLLWLDDPISGGTVGDKIGVLQYICNADILGIPANDNEVADVQAEAFNVGLSIAEKIRTMQSAYSLIDFSFISLRDYYDNNAAGYRFTYTIKAANPVNLCAEYFDPEKQFDTRRPLPDFSVENPDGCAVFRDKNGLPNFKV